MTATWKDVTSMLRAAAGELTNQNPMVQTENFSLNDSMAAVEIMDPIMDQCCGVTGSMKQQDLLVVQYPADSIAVSTAVKLCQALFIYEAGFLDGASLMESIKQCIFSWEGSWAALQERGASSVVDRAVLAYCQSLVFSTGSQFTAVMAADIYEDEDFQPGYRSLLSDKSLNGEQLLTELQSVIAELESSITEKTEHTLEVSYLTRLLKTRLQLQKFFQHTGKFVHTTIQEYSSLLKKRNANHAAALARAEKRSEQVEQGLAPVADEPGDNSLEQALEQLVQSQKKRSQDSCKDIHKLAQETAAVLEQLLEFHSTAGIEPETSASSLESIFSDISHPNQCSEISFALSSKLVKLHQTGPIRRVSMKSYIASVRYVQAICREFSDVTTTTTPFFQRPTVLTVAAATTAIVAGSKSAASAREPAVLTLDYVLSTAMHTSAAGLHLLSRGYFLAVLYVLSVEIAALIWASMFSQGLPRTLIESDLVSLHWIQGNPSAAVWETLKGIVVCRSRLLASRLQNMLDLWAHVASEAVYVDSRFHADINGPEVASKSAIPQLQWCSLWALQYTVQVMDLHMALVAEMDLVGLDEWDYFYWYWDYLCSTGVYTSEKLRTQRFQVDMQMYETAKAEVAARSAENKKSSGKKGKKGSAASSGSAESNALPPVLPVMLQPSREELLLKGRGMLCRGVYRMCALAGAAPLGKGVDGSGAPLIDKAEGKYSSWEARFTHRFLAFAQLSNPPPLSYSDFQRATGKAATTDSSGTVVVVRDPALLGNLVQGAMLCYQNARKVFDEARLMTSTAPAATPAGTNTTTAAADKYAQATVVSLTKVSVASALAAMKAGLLIKDSAAALQGGSTGRGACVLGVNRSYSKHFSVLEITPPPTATINSTAASST